MECEALDRDILSWMGRRPNGFYSGAGLWNPGGGRRFGGESKSPHN